MTIDIIAAIITVSVLAVVYVSACCTDIRHCRSLRSVVERRPRSHNQRVSLDSIE
jgi:hypothetical protein